MALTVQEKMYTAGDWMAGKKPTAGIGAAFAALVLVKGLIGGTRGGRLLRNVVLSGALSSATLQIAGRILIANGVDPQRLRPPDTAINLTDQDPVTLKLVGDPVRPTEYEVQFPDSKDATDEEKVYLVLEPCASKDWKVRVGTYGSYQAALIWDDGVKPSEEDVLPHRKVKLEDGTPGTLYVLNENARLSLFLKKYAPKA